MEKLRAAKKESEAAVAFAERSLRSEQDLFSQGLQSELNRQRAELSVEQQRRILRSKELDLEVAEKGPRAEDLRKSEIEVERKRAAVAQAERGLAHTRVSGVRAGRAFVGRIWVTEGQWVESGKAVAELVYMDRLRVELDLPVEDALRVARGGKATLRSPRFPGVPLEGTVESVSPVVDPGAGTVRVVVAADNADLRLRPGVEAEVEIR